MHRVCLPARACKNAYVIANKKLKGELDQFYRYRIGKHRLFYQIDDNRVLVFIITLRDRKDACRQ